MAVTVQSFKAAFPEFQRAADALVQTKIDEAELEVGTAWGTTRDLGVSYLTAHLLSIAAQGQQARLVPANAKATREDALTVYERRYRELRLQVASGGRVTAGSVCNPEEGGGL